MTTKFTKYLENTGGYMKLKNRKRMILNCTCLFVCGWKMD